MGKSGLVGSLDRDAFMKALRAQKRDLEDDAKEETRRRAQKITERAKQLAPVGDAQKGDRHPGRLKEDIGGDLLLLHAPLEASWMTGLHVVLDVGKHAASVVPAHAVESARNFYARPRHIVAHYPAKTAELQALPAFSKPMDLDQPEPQPAAPPAPKPKEIRFVEVWLPGDRPGLGLRYPRSEEWPNGREVLYSPVRRQGAGTVFNIDFALLDSLLSNFPASGVLDPDAVQSLRDDVRAAQDEAWRERNRKARVAGGS